MFKKTSILAYSLCLIPSISLATENVSDLFSIKDTEVVSVSKKSESAFDAASAIYVITQDDIRRSGATSIPEVLRLAPGVEVARIDSNKWAISARGFNRQFANKMLVIIDGRSVYNPLFAGTYWDAQDTMLEDIDRIEVIRGPGGTVWGANAVNGVINIITKDARLTQGNVASVSLGTEDKVIGSYRYGGKINEDAYYRIYGKYTDIDGAELTNGTDKEDDAAMKRSGFRVDWSKGVANNFTLQGDIYDGYNQQSLNLVTSPTPLETDEDTTGANILFEWRHIASSSSSYSIQSYYDYTKRDIQGLEQEKHTFDIEFQNDLKTSPRNQLSWGLGYRMFYDKLISESVNGSVFLEYTPNESYNNLYSAFVQNKYAVVPDKLYLTAGSKFEHNYYTDFEVQPSIRVSWHPDNRSTVWSSISHSVRIPSRGERTISLTVNALSIDPPILIRQVGTESIDAETMVAYEMGYRYKPKNNIKLDAALFFNDYDNLRSFEPNGTLNIPLGNKASGEAFGGELIAQWQVLKDWQLELSYSYLNLQLHIDEDSNDTTSENDEDASPDNQIKLRSHVNLDHNIEFDTLVYFVDDLDSFNINSYTRLDLRLGWKPIKDVELSLVGQNLLDDRHQEFSEALFAAPAEIERSVYGKITYKF